MPKGPRSISGPNKKRKLSEESSSFSATQDEKWQGASGSLSAVGQKGNADGDAWLAKSVARFGLQICAQPAVSEAQWKHYFRSRTLLEFMEAATSAQLGSDKDEIWPDDLGPQPYANALGIESYTNQKQPHIVSPIRSSVESLVASSSLKVDAASLSGGLFLLSFSEVEPSDSGPESVIISTRLYAPNRSGHFVDLTYESHKYACSGSIVRYSHLYALRDGLHDDCGKACTNATDENRQEKHWRYGICKPDRIFELEMNECGHGELGTRALVTVATLGKICKHIFGKTRALSPRKMFSLLVRSAGVGLCGEDKKSAISQACNHFKKGEHDIETDGV